MTSTFVLTFYDFVAAIIPGSIFLVGCFVLFDMGKLSQILLPNNSGSMGIHIIIAYVAGQLIQAIGNWIEVLYWKIWKGMPTDWPISNSKKEFPTTVIDNVFSLCGEKKEDICEDELLSTWKNDLNTVRQKILSNNPNGRIQTFNSLYGLFRGLFTAFLLLIITNFIINQTFSKEIIILVILCILSLFRMHRYAIYYANELFYSIRWLYFQTNKQGGKNG